MTQQSFPPVGDSQPHPRIRSYILRQGRITNAQRNALERLWPRYGMDAGIAFDAPAAFARFAPLILEIGFGNGETLAAMAEAQPDTNFLGVEVHQPGIGHLLLLAESKNLGNLRVYCADTVGILETCLPDSSLDGINIYFPDPWPKKRHHKRRLVNPEFVRLATSRLKIGGLLHVATDWKDYADQILQVLEESQDLKNCAGRFAFASRPESRPLTKFEARGQFLGHGVWDILFVRS